MSRFTEALSDATLNVAGFIHNHAKMIRLTVAALATASAVGSYAENQRQQIELDSYAQTTSSVAYRTHEYMRYDMFGLPVIDSNGNEIRTTSNEDIRSQYTQYSDLMTYTTQLLQGIRENREIFRSSGRDTFLHFLDGAINRTILSQELINTALSEGRLLNRDEVLEIRAYNLFLHRETESFVYQTIWSIRNKNTSLADKENIIMLLSTLIAVVTALTGIKINLHPDRVNRLSQKRKNQDQLDLEVAQTPSENFDPRNIIHEGDSETHTRLGELLKQSEDEGKHLNIES
jgi:hypothetical protein